MPSPSLQRAPRSLAALATCGLLLATGLAGIGAGTASATADHAAPKALANARRLGPSPLASERVVRLATTDYAAPVASTTDSVSTFGSPTTSASTTLLDDNGGWCWFQDERSLFTADGRLLVSSVASRGGVDGNIRSGATQVTSYDLTRKQVWTDSIGVGQMSDDHNVAGLIELPDRRLYAMWAGHSLFPYIYRGYQDPGDLAFTRQDRMYRPEADVYDPTLGRKSGVTYSNLEYLADENGGKGRLYDFFRSSGERPKVIYSDDRGDTWTDGGELWNRYRAYARYKSDGRSKIWFIVTDGHPSVLNGTSLYSGYLQNGRLYGPDGTDAGPVGSSIEPSALGPKSLIAAGVPGDASVEVDYWGSDIELDPVTHLPVVTFSDKHPGVSPVPGKSYQHDYFQGRWDGTSWTVVRIAHGGSELLASQPDYTGLSAVDPADPSRVFISTDVDPVTGTPLTSTADGLVHHEIFEGKTTDSGATWAWSSVTQNSSTDNLRPIVPVERDGHWALLWLRGAYPNFVAYDQAIVGIIDPEGGGTPVAAPNSRPPSLGYHVAGQQPYAGDFDGNGQSDLGFDGAPAVESSEVLFQPNGHRRSLQLARYVGVDVTPVVGDFNGDGRDDRLDYTPGATTDFIRYRTPDGHATTFPLSIGGTYRPVAGDFNGDGRDDVYWYAPGTAADEIWYGTATKGSFTKRSVTISGDYRPFVGDFDGNGRDDVFWFGPGTAADYLHLSQPGGSFQSIPRTVNGLYRPVAGDFNGDGRDDVFWYAPGRTADSIWFGVGSGSFRTATTAVNGDYLPVTGDFNGDGRSDVAFYAGASPIRFWYGSTNFPISR